MLYRLSLSKEDRRVEAYLNGQEIAVEKEELRNFLIADRKVKGNSKKSNIESDKKSDKEGEKKSDKGLVLCACDGLPLGFGYYRNGRLRNLYPKGIRFKK